MVVLSGGPLGGVEIEWEKAGLLGDRREYVDLDGYWYAKVSETQAIFVKGPEGSEVAVDVPSERRLGFFEWLFGAKE